MSPLVVSLSPLVASFSQLKQQISRTRDFIAPAIVAPAKFGTA
jgi:hypothetical protein